MRLPIAFRDNQQISLAGSTHWDTPPNRTGKGKAPQKGNKKTKNNNLSWGKDKKGKGKAPQHGQQKQIANVKQIHITDLPDNFEADYISDCKSIDFSCYVLRENSEWLMDSGCNRHVTSHLEDYVSYQRFSKPGSAEIANKEELHTRNGYSDNQAHPHRRKTY